MAHAFRLCALIFVFALVGCGDDTSENPGTGGVAGTGGMVGTGGMAGSGGMTGTGGTAGAAGIGGIGGAAGVGGNSTMVEPCTDDQMCGVDDDCVCPECDDDLFCGNPENCENDGICREFEEGCVCEDCANLPVCDR
jgi:hypothetical protein